MPTGGVERRFSCIAREFYYGLRWSVDLLLCGKQRLSYRRRQDTSIFRRHLWIANEGCTQHVRPRRLTPSFSCVLFHSGLRTPFSRMALLFDPQNALEGIQRVRYSELISSIIIVYDHAITLGQEIELIWKAGWSFGKCLFLLNRYYALSVVIFNNYVLFGPGVSTTMYEIQPASLHPSQRKLIAHPVGIHWFKWQAATGIVTFVFGELILQLRLLALYNLNRKILALMACTFVLALVGTSTILGVALSQVTVISIPVHLFSLSTSICAVTNLDAISYLYTFWIPMMISESVLCALVTVRAFERMREARRARRKFTWMQNGRELVVVLIRDSILYFLVLFAVYLTNTILFRQNNLITTESAISYAVSLSCIMGSRLCLNVRGMVSESSHNVQADSDRDALTARHELSQGQSTSSAVTPRTPASGSQRWPITVFSKCSMNEADAHGRLSEYELMELRAMKADV